MFFLFSNKIVYAAFSMIAIIIGASAIHTAEVMQSVEEQLTITKLPLEFTDEYSPACVSLTEDGRLLAFQSPHPDGFGRSDIWLSDYVNGSWSEPYNAGTGINTDASEYDGKLSADGSRMVFIRSDDDMRPSIFISHFKNGEWTEAEAMGPPISYPDQTEYGAVFSRNGNRLYFSSNREGGYNGFDVYYSDMTDEGWGDPVNMGPEINSKGDAIDAAISRDEKTIILAFRNEETESEELNLYRIKKSDDGWGSYENLGPRFNTPGNDACPWLGYDGHTLIVNSTWDGLMGGKERTDTRWGILYSFYSTSGF